MKNRRKTIQSRLVLLLVMVLVPVIGLQAYMYYGAFQERKAAELRSNLEIARATAKSFDTFVKNVLRLELAIGFALTSSPGSNREGENRILLRTREDNPELWEIFWVSPKGVVLSATGTQFLGMNFADREYFKEIVAGREYVISDLLLSRATGKPSFTISRAIRDKKGVLIGVVIIGILPERLDKTLGVERFKGGGLAVVDSKGMLVFRYPVIETTWEKRHWLEQYPQFGDALKGKEVSATVYAPFEGKNRMVSFTPIPSIGWAASAGQREEEVTGPILAAIGKNAVIAGLILAMAFFIALSVARRIANPIMMLRQYALALGREQGRQPLPAQSVSELNDLADAFNTMGENVRARETALQESERRWATTLASVGDAVIATDIDGTIIFMNAMAEQLTGWTISEAVTKPATAIFNIINEQTRKQVESPITRVLREEVAVSLANHTILVRKDGTEVSIDDSGAPIRDRDGNIRGVVLVFRNITERKRMEEELYRSRDELELRVRERTESLRRQAELLELAHNAIVVRDMENRITFWNRGAEEMYGWTKDEAQGTVGHHLLKTKFPESLEDTIATLMRTGAWEGELEHTTKDGRTITVLSRRVLQRDEAGNPAATLEINLDITAAKQAENQLRQSQKMEALGTLAGGIAHDFNNLLGAVIGFAELLQEDLPAGSPGHRHATRVMEAGLRGRDLVKQMLTFSRRTELEKKPLRLSSIVKESLKLLRSSIPTTVSIKVDVTSESGVILADPVQIQQVLMNLCTNAYYAMRETGGALGIELSDFNARPSDKDARGIEPGLYMKLTVSDTGIGIPAEIKDRIFDPFFTTKPVGEGTGLGLSVVMGIVKKSGGHITVESEPGKGSTFTVYFPEIAENTVTDTAAGEDPLPSGSEHILFVDDEDALLEIGEQLLTKLGYRVTSENSSPVALSLIEENPSHFDLVITDQTMPEMTGLELAKRILAIRSDMPVILCTGFSHLIDAEGAKAAGIRAFVMKPLTKRKIAKTIRQVLGGKS